MKQKGKCIVGNQRNVDDYTADWMSVRIHPATFYRRMKEFQDSLDTTKGLYAELDMGSYILLRFSEKEDVTSFHRTFHACI